MPLVRQELDLPLVAGLAQHVRTESRDPMQGFDTLLNTVQDKAGAYTKRPGSTPLTSGPTAAIALHSLRNQMPILNDGKLLHAYGKSAWWERGGAPTLDVTRTGLHSVGVPRDYGGAIGITSPVLDTAQTNGVLAIAYASPTHLFFECFDATTKAPLLGPTKIHAILGATPYIVAAQIMPTMVTVGNKIIAIWRRVTWPAGTPEDALWFSVLDTANLGAGWSAAAQLVGPGILFVGAYTAVGNDYVRPVAVGLTTRFVIAVRDAAATLLVMAFTDAGVNLMNAAPFGAMVPGVYAIGGREDREIWVAGAPFAGVRIGGNVSLVALNPTTLVTTGAVLVAAWAEQMFFGQNEWTELIGIVSTAAGSCRMVVGNVHYYPAAVTMRQGYLGWREYTITAGNVAGVGTASSAYNLHPFADPFLLPDGRVAVVATPYDTFNNPSSNDQWVRNWQKGLFVVDISADRSGVGDVRPLASIAPRVCTANTGFQTELWSKQMATMPSGAKALAVPVMRSGQTEAYELVEFIASTSTSSAEVGGNLHMSGGVAWQYDGERSLESAFLVAPRVRVEAVTAGPGLTGIFYYVAVYEHVDAAGNLHQSAPSAPVTSAAVPANQTNPIVITTCPLTMRQDLALGADRVRIVLYRTEAGGSTYYRYKEFDNYDPTSATWFRGYVTYNDNVPDGAAYYGSALSARPRLYTQPGTNGTPLPRVAPSSLRYVVQHGDVVAGIGDSGRRIWVSAPRVEGEGAWFSDAMVVEVEDTSPLVALASLDGRLFAFTATGIHVVDGSGFAENGTGGYSLPQRIASDAGCIDSRSVVSTPAGVLFQSPTGIALLSRAGQVTYFGAAVQDTLAAYPTIYAATLDPANGRVLFQCVSAAGAGMTLIFDYTSAVWTTSQRGDTAAAQSAAVIGGVYHYATPAGQVHSETTGYVDNAAWVGQTWETGWIKFTGLQGYQRIWRLILRFNRRSAFALRVSFAYDYSDTYTAVDFTDPEIFIAAAAGPGSLEIAPARQRCQAMRVKIEELAGNGQGMELLGIRVVWAKESRTPFARGAKR